LHRIVCRPNATYCKWIRQDESWGGAIEISILCELLRIEIDVIDVAAGRVTRFAENRRFDKRMFLYYDLVHYVSVELACITLYVVSVCIYLH
jgi:ubiquitin thioesterase OTU1